MTLTLHVDGDRWRAHLRQALEGEPLLVPVAKGNGYGFGNARLARKAAWLADQGLGCDTIAVGTYAEISDVHQRFSGDIVVLSPWRPFTHGAVEALADPRVIHTVGRLSDLESIRGVGGDPRLLLERMTSMKRHGFTARGLREAAREGRFEGASVHLPLDTSGGADNLAELDELMSDVLSAGLGGTVHVSHLSAAQLDQIRQRFPDTTFRLRVGTGLWLGDRGALRVTATVLDRHEIERGDTFGYRARSIPRTGTILVVSGGTAHGIGLEAPTGEGSLRARAASVARGGLDAMGAVKSPYTVSGKARYFAEPPHMQASMLFLPSGAEVPEIGDQVDVRVRFTATAFDRVLID